MPLQWVQERTSVGWKGGVELGWQISGVEVRFGACLGKVEPLWNFWKGNCDGQGRSKRGFGSDGGGEREVQRTGGIAGKAWLWRGRDRRGKPPSHRSRSLVIKPGGWWPGRSTPGWPSSMRRHFAGEEPCPACGEKHLPKECPHDLGLQTEDGEVPASRAGLPLPAL